MKMDADRLKELQKSIRPILLPFSILYGLYVNGRNMLYDKGVFKENKFNIKIISVGNIAVGGVGKTPIVIEIAKILKDFGRVCIVTNSYGGILKKPTIVSIDNVILQKPPLVSDEAYIIANKTGCTIISAKERIKAIKLAEYMNFNYIILDDALHKRCIHRDIDICVVDNDNPFEDNLYLPAGSLRDAKSSINRCNVIICVNNNNLFKKIDCLEAKFKVVGVFNSLGYIKEYKSAFVFCGIGKPVNFLDTVRFLGIHIKGYKFFPDHYLYTRREIEKLKKLKESSHSDLLLTTFKDWVKINDNDVYYVDVDMEIENTLKLEELLR